MTLALAVVAAFLFGCGTYLLLQRALTRIVFGLALIGHGTNLLLLLSGGHHKNPPLIGVFPAPYADPLPQAMALTAIVINFAVVVFLLTMAYRSYILTRHDLVEDDREDRHIAQAQQESERRSGIDTDTLRGGEFQTEFELSTVADIGSNDPEQSGSEPPADRP